MQSTSPRLSDRSKWAILAALVLALILLLLAAAEVAVRLRQAARFGVHNGIEERFVQDAQSGLRIGRAGFTSGDYHVNSLGFRGPELVQPKPAGRIRIAYLGASTTACEEVADNRLIWPHLVTARLAAAFPGREFDYVNGGMAGYTVASSTRNLEKRIAPLQPDVIVIYHATNDLSQELRELARQQGLIGNAGFQEFSAIGKHLLLWNLVEKNLRVLAAQRQATQQQGRLTFQSAKLGEQFRERYRLLARQAQQQGRLVALVTFSSHLRALQTAEEQAEAMASAIFYMPFMDHARLLQAYARYNQVIREVAAETGALLIDGEDEIPANSRYFHDTVHFTAAGNEAMAERVSVRLLNAPQLARLAKEAAAQ